MSANGMHQVDLAWALADAADRCVDPLERGRICVTLGAGDTDQAIRALSAAAIRAHLALPTPVAAALASWWRVEGADDRTCALIAALPKPPDLTSRPVGITPIPAARKRPV